MTLLSCGQSSALYEHVEAEAFKGRLAAAGITLITQDGAVAGDGSGPYLGSLPVRVTGSPQPWYRFADAVELPSLDDLVECADILRRVSASGALFAGGPVEWRRVIETRLGSGLGPGEELWLFGAGLVGRQAARSALEAGAQLAGFLDNDPSLRGSRLEGLPVLAPAEVDLSDATIAVCTGGHHVAIIDQLNALDAGRILGLSELLFLLDESLEPEGAYRDDLWANRCRYVGLALRLEDEASVNTLAALIKYRLSLIPLSLEGAVAGDQWFVPEVFRPDRMHVFVDGGGYTGDTAEDFVRRNGGPGVATHIFEPDPALVAEARARFAGLPGVYVHAAGLGSRRGSASFTATGSMNGSITDIGGSVVALETIDDVVPGTPTFIKLDVEGSELAALEGARESILAGRPTLAVAVYHHARDLWCVPRWIDELDLGYEFRLRHHTELAFETVFYASQTRA